jgi:hypothetical protein
MTMHNVVKIQCDLLQAIYQAKAGRRMIFDNKNYMGLPAYVIWKNDKLVWESTNEAVTICTHILTGEWQVDISPPISHETFHAVLPRMKTGQIFRSTVTGRIIYQSIDDRLWWELTAQNTPVLLRAFSTEEIEGLWVAQ